MPGKCGAPFVAAAPTDAVEILAGFVDRVCRAREGDVPAQKTVEVFALPDGLVRPRLSRLRVVGDRLGRRLVLPVPEGAERGGDDGDLRDKADRA